MLMSNLPQWGLRNFNDVFEPLAARFLGIVPPRLTTTPPPKSLKSTLIPVKYLTALLSSSSASILRLQLHIRRILAISSLPASAPPSFASRVQSLAQISVPTISITIPFSQSASQQMSFPFRVLKKAEEYMITYPSILLASVGFCVAFGCFIIFSLGYWGEERNSDGREWVRRWAEDHGRVFYTPPARESREQRRKRKAAEFQCSSTKDSPFPPASSSSSATVKPMEAHRWPSLPTLSPITYLRAAISRILPAADRTPIDHSRIIYIPGGYNTDDQTVLYWLPCPVQLSKAGQRALYQRTVDSSSSEGDVDSDLPVDEGYFSPTMITPVTTPRKEVASVTPTKGSRVVKGRRGNTAKGFDQVPTPPATPPMDGRRGLVGYTESVGGGDEKEKRRKERRERKEKEEKEGRKKGSSRRSIIGF